MPISGATDLLDALRQGRLLEPAHFEEINRDLLARLPEPLDLARELVRRGWLTPFQVNQIFAGRGRELLLGSYVLLTRLGEGGMGQVFKARHWKLGNIVALKIVRKERMAKPDAVRRFQREVQAAAQLAHPNIVAAYDADQVGDRYYFAMEYVEGTDLSRLVKEQGPLPVAAACDYARQAALGLQHAFERGLTHRDIKPANLLLTQSEVVKILDMGLARLEATENGDGGSTLTHDGVVMGTPDYIAPEQARDAHSADIRADLYSLGCTLYFMLTGQVPFPAGSLTRKLLRHQLDPPPPVEKLRPDVPPALSAVICRLMAKDPADRYQTPAEVVVAFAGAHTAAIPQNASPAPPAAEPEESFAGLSASTLDRPGDTVRSPRTSTGARPFHWPLLLAGLAVLGLVTLLAVWFSKMGTPPAPGVPQTPQTPATRLERSPLDQLDAARIRPQPGMATPPKDVVAVLHGKTPPGRVAVAVAPDGKAMATAGADRGIHLWALSGGALIEQQTLKAELANALAFVGAGKVLAAGHGIAGKPGTVTLWDVANGTPQGSWTGPKDAVMQVASSADGKLLATGCRDGSIALWDVDTGKIRQTFRPFAQTILSLALVPDGKTLAVVHAGQPAQLWHAGASKAFATLVGPDAKATALALSPDGKTLATAAPGRLVVLWDVAAECILHTLLDEPTGKVGGLAFAPDGKTLAAASSNGQVIVWDTTSPKKSRRVWEMPEAVGTLAFAPDSRHLAIASAQGTVYVLRLAPPPPKAGP